MTPDHRSEKIKELEDCIANMSMVYNFGDSYRAAQSELIKLKNPRPNYNVARRSAIQSYLGARKWKVQGSYNTWARQHGLSQLKQIKAEFKEYL